MMRCTHFFCFLCGLWLLLAQGCSRVAVPPEPVSLGINLEGYPLSAARLASHTREIGFAPAVIGFYLQWPETTSASAPEDPLNTFLAIDKAGAVPMLTWEPMNWRTGSETAIPDEEILAGVWNPYLRTMATAMTAFRKPVLIRFAHEMNLERYHWGTEKNAFGEKSPGLYKDMFRFVRDEVLRQGASNTLWIFCPNAESIPSAQSASFSWNTFASFFPGTSSVDILALDGYNWGSSQTRAKNGWDSRWQSPEEIFSAPCRELFALAPDLPRFICETASVASGADRLAWIQELEQFCRSRAISAVVWFQVQKETEWQITASETGVFQKAASGSEAFRKRLKELLQKRDHKP
jgi:hypothetical protein